jgi:hypothetical protein
MKTPLVITMVLGVIAFSVLAANLSDNDKQFLSVYDKVRAALVADDLSSAKFAAKDLGGDGAEMANAATLKDARAAFEKLSARATTVVAGEKGYYVVHCPMLKKDWVQTTEKIANPYAGKDMKTCGEIKK